MEDVDPSAVDAGRVAHRQRQAVVDERSCGARDQAGEGSVAGGALGEHSQQEGGKERRVDQGEDQLQRVHDVVEAGDGVGRANGQDYPPDGGHSPHPEVVCVGAFLVDVGLVDVIGPDGVECGDVAGHSRHEAGQQGGEAEAQDAGGEEGEQHDGDGLVVVVDQDSVGIDHVLAGDGIGLDRDDAVGMCLVERQGLALGVDVGGGDGGVCPVCQPAGVGGDGDGDEAGQDDQEGEEHLGHGGDERDLAGGVL